MYTVSRVWQHLAAVWIPSTHDGLSVSATQALGSQVVVAALGASGYAVAHDRAARTVGNGMMGGGMMGGGMGRMMDGCRCMMQGGGMGSGQPNAQWEGRGQKVPPAETEKPQ